MESPQKKPAIGNIFGASSGANTTGSTFTFGQSVQPQANGGINFGSTQPSNNTPSMNGGGLFGNSSKPEATASPSNPFASLGQPKQPQQSSFSGFAPAAASPQSETSTFAFGQPASATPSQKPSFSFGQTSTSSAPTFAPAQTPGAGQPPNSTFFSEQTPAQAPLPGFSSAKEPSGNQDQPKTPSLFSVPKSSISQESATSNAPPPSFLFGKSQPTPGTPIATTSGASLSSGFSLQTKEASPERGTSPAKVPDDNTAIPKNPFAGLFGQPTTTPQPAKPLFGLANSTLSSVPAATSNSSSALDKPADKHAPAFTFGQPAAQAVKSTPSFAFGQTAAPPPSSAGLFSPTNSNTESNNLSSNLFGSAPSAEPLSNPPIPSSEGPKPFAGASTGLQTKPAFSFGTPSPAGSKPGVASTSPNKPTVQATEDGVKKQASVANPQSVSKQPVSGISTPRSAPPIQTAGRETTSTTLSEVTETTPRPVYTKAAPFIPGSLHAEQYRSYDRNYRLHSLNVGLQKKLSEVDPRSFDFDNIIRHYVAARESIGESLGLYERNLAGAKRKSDRAEDQDDSSSRNKRTRSEGSVEKTIPSTASFASATSTTSKPQSLFALSSPAAQTGPSSSPSRATELFRDMIPGSSDSQSDKAKPFNSFAGIASQPSSTQSSTIPNPSNPFASLAPGSNTLATTPSSSHKPAAASTSAISGPSSNIFASPSKESQVETSQTEIQKSTVAESTTPKKSSAKPAFEMPKFGTGGANFMAAFGQQAKQSADKFEKSQLEKRKMEEFDSDEDDEETFYKQIEEEKKTKRAKIEAIARGGFVPSFGQKSGQSSTALSVSGGTTDALKGSGLGSSFLVKKGSVSSATASPNPFASLGAAATSKKQPHLAVDDTAENQSSSEGNEDSKDGEDGEEAGASGGSEEDDSDDSPDDDAANQDDEDEDDEASGHDGDMTPSPNAGRSLFDRIEPNPNMTKTRETPNGIKNSAEDDSSAIFQSAKNPAFKKSLWGSQIGQDTPEQPTFSPITPSTTDTTPTYKPATTFTFTAPPAASRAPTPGASIFAGGLTKNGPIPGEGMFGSRPSTPSNGDKAGDSNPLSRSVLASPPGTDNTWKQGAPITFGASETSAPSFKFTAASPGASSSASTQKPFGSLFGTSGTDSKSAEAPKVGFSFGAQPSSPAPGFLGAVSHLGGGSAASSAMSSRATSPGLTDTESVATNDTEESTDPQTSLMESRAGEENEDCLWEGRSKALMFVNKDSAEGTKLKPNDWNSMGVGLARVLKDKTTNKTRVLFRVEPSASILINSHLIESTVYENMPSQKSGAVKGTLLYKGNLSRWVFKVKTPEMAKELTRILEENKAA